MKRGQKKVENGYKMLYTRKMSIRNAVGLILDEALKTKKINV